MSRHENVLQRILHGGADANIDVDDLCALLGSFASSSGHAAVITYPAIPASRNC